jgi:thioredoxin 1
MQWSPRRFWGIAFMALYIMILGPVLPGWGKEAPASHGKPALYDFGRGMCIPCMEMEKILGSIKDKYGNQIEVRLVMAEKDEGMFKEYKIMLIPTQVFLDASGKEVFRHIGLYPEKELVAKLQELNFIKK